MAFDRFDFMSPREPSIAVHYEGNMLGNGALPQSPNEQLS
jgi:hypothetical protein